MVYGKHITDTFWNTTAVGCKKCGRAMKQEGDIFTCPTCGDWYHKKEIEGMVK